MATRPPWHQNPDAGIVKIMRLWAVCGHSRGRGAPVGLCWKSSFFAPELLQRPAYDGARADLFSLGAVMVELIFGHDF